MKYELNKNILQLLNLPVMQDIYDLAKQTRLSEKLLYILADEKNLYRYNAFTIRKRSGGYRQIHAPIYSLKIVQRWILENILYKLNVSPHCYGFSKSVNGSPIVNNAQNHKNNIFLLKLDLKDFFPTIRKDRIFNQLKSIGYNDYIANLLTNICTYNKSLPQGAVTSPYLANLICFRLDTRLSKYCSRREIAYSRYADDLTFSSNNRDLLKNVYGMFVKIIEDEGFIINNSKTKFMTPKTHKSITGITISNKVLKAPKEMKRKVRAMIHHAIISGNYKNLDKIRGYISYINSIEHNYREKIIEYIDKFKNKDITYFPDAVDAFNTNKIFSDVNDFALCNIIDIDDDIDLREAYYEHIQCERDDFLKRNNYV